MCDITYQDIEKSKVMLKLCEKRIDRHGDKGIKVKTQLAEQQLSEKVPRTVWTKEEILKRIETREDWAFGALMAIYKNQTADEQGGEYTKEHNSKGFTKFDAELLTSFSKQYESKKWLSRKQLIIIRKRIPKYWRQLVKAANKGV